jgi:spore germination protein GerM
MLARLSIVFATLALAAPAASGTSTVHVFFVYGEHGVAVHRSAPAAAPARAAVQALLAGPRVTERRHRLSSAVPAGTRLLGLAVRARVAAVDLSSRFSSGGGSLSMYERLAQLVFTLTAVRGIDRVTLKVDGRVVRVFSGEGLMLRQPLARSDYQDFIP